MILFQGGRVMSNLQILDLNILYVEDDLTVRESIQRVLSLKKVFNLNEILRD